VTESFSIVPPLPQPTPLPRAAAAAASGPAKGALIRVLPTGEVETIWTSSDDMPHAVAALPDGVLVGTGDKGKLYRIRDDRTWTMVSSYPAEQVTALARGASGAVFLATSNPGKIHVLEGAPSARGTLTSKVKDTETVSAWGRIRWEAALPGGTEIQVQTRSGNTATPDTTWSEWSASYARSEGDPVTSERARFLQVRAVLLGKGAAGPVLDSITTAYLQRNLRPLVQSITMHPPGEVFQRPLTVTGEIEILGSEPGEGPEIRSGAPIPARPSMAATPTAYSRRFYQRGMQTFSWKAEDPNGDTLVYDVQYRTLGDTRLRTLRKGVSEAVLAWDTSTVPNGRYLIRVTARDTASNPEPLALSGEKESTPFDVDNTPPDVGASLLAGGRRVRALVKDDDSLIKKAEYSVDGGRWHEVHPTDGINDAREESYEIAPEASAEAGPHLVVVRATDLLGNVATARVELP
jgi:hypothetical protein